MWFVFPGYCARIQWLFFICRAARRTGSGRGKQKRPRGERGGCGEAEGLVRWKLDDSWSDRQTSEGLLLLLLLLRNGDSSSIGRLDRVTRWQGAGGLQV